MRNHGLLKPVLILFSILFSGHLLAQPTWTLDLFGNEKKPEQYEEKKLPSEKTGEKKFTSIRRFIQNNTTRYNYYFNATNKINSIIEMAKLSQQNDYTRLLPFYPYSLDATAAQKPELDSVIYKATGGILLHDLRSDWVDNMYLLIGKAYFFRKDFDSAALTFQFINYNLFPRKKNEDDSRTVGSNENGSKKFSIANTEKQNILQRTTGLPPSRNDALLWLVRTLIEQEKYGEAAGMINILSEDPNLPKRLKDNLEEIKAYWFYKQEIYDSSANHLELALSAAADKQDRSRWEFLIAQMSEMTGNFDKASEYYVAASKHTVDPVMDIYARLNDAKMERDEGNVRELEKSIANLTKMAKRDRFEAYRDIIYYSIAQLNMEKPDTAAATANYLKSIKYNTNNTAYRNKSFLHLGDLAYIEKKYINASDYYDSLMLGDESLKENVAKITEKKNSLNNIAAQIRIIQREDSLQRIAAMDPDDRDAFIRKLVKKARKLQGLKDEDDFSGSSMISFSNDKDEPIDLFSSSTKGDWYFYNNSMKSKGFNEFKSRWGKRANADNWRRKSATSIASAGNKVSGMNSDDPLGPGSKALGQNDAQTTQNESAPATYDSYMANLPLSPEMMDSSNAKIERSLIALGKIFQNEMENYPEAIRNYEECLSRFPGDTADVDVYFGLFYCYNKLGNPSKADYYKNLVVSKYPGSNPARAITNPASLHPEQNNPEAMARYSQVYNLFIEGKFQEAVAEKLKADSVYGKNYWTPQLLYIEAISYIKERKDSAAFSALGQIVELYPTSPLKEKAATLISVLKRRSEIETYLTNLQVTRAPDDDKILIKEDANVPTVQKPEEPEVTQQKIIAPVLKPKSALPDTIGLPASMVSGSFIWQSDVPYVVVMVLDKVDPVYVNEAKNAMARYNRENFSSRKIVLNKETFNANLQWITFESFSDASDALNYYDRLKKSAPNELSWLPANKYSFFIISHPNIGKLRENKDFPEYKALLEKQYPGRF